jgi:ATP-dependent protease HslVU (ClpYQ) peptidase subunit
MAADTRITGVPMFQMEKIFRVGQSLYGISGSPEQCLKFIEWRRQPDQKPTFQTNLNFTVLEINPTGIFFWNEEMQPLPVPGDFYAVGSGANFALGALSMGASLKKSIAIAARWDEGTGHEVQSMSLRAKT